MGGIGRGSPVRAELDMVRRAHVWDGLARIRRSRLASWARMRPVRAQTRPACYYKCLVDSQEVLDVSGPAVLADPGLPHFDGADDVVHDAAAEGGSGGPAGVTRGAARPA